MKDEIYALIFLPTHYRKLPLGIVESRNQRTVLTVESLQAQSSCPRAGLLAKVNGQYCEPLGSEKKFHGPGFLTPRDFCHATWDVSSTNGSVWAVPLRALEPTWEMQWSKEWGWGLLEPLERRSPLGRYSIELSFFLEGATKNRDQFEDELQWDKRYWRHNIAVGTFTVEFGNGAYQSARGHDRLYIQHRLDTDRFRPRGNTANDDDNRDCPGIDGGRCESPKLLSKTHEVSKLVPHAKSPPAQKKLSTCSHCKGSGMRKCNCVSTKGPDPKHGPCKGSGLIGKCSFCNGKGEK